MVTTTITDKTKLGTSVVQDIQNFTFTVTEKTPQYTLVDIAVAHNYVDSLYQKALVGLQEKAITYGFTQGATPLNYIEQNFKPHILDHLKELLFIHCVMGFLCNSLYAHKLVSVGDPELVDIIIAPGTDAHFVFKLQSIPYDADDRWKRIQLKAPERKNYKDLDRQVESFIKEEEEKASTYSEEKVAIGDWVCFEVSLIKDEIQLLKNYADELWVKINDEEADIELHELFLGRKRGDRFLSKSPFLQEYVSNKLDMNYMFSLHVKDFVPHNHFNFESFRRHFAIKSAKEMHLKLIEIFSYRNDISQRRETVEAVFKALTKHYSISIPKSLLEHKRQLVLQQVQDNPDYHVYKAQADFKERIRQLAEKQLRETIITDTIAHQENVQVTHEDIISYLNILKRARTKEFLYFDTPIRNRGLETPINTELLKQYCLREKTLNHIIQHLTKK